MKISRAGETLTDDARTDGLVTLLDELSVRLLRKYDLCQARDEQRIDDSKQDGSCDSHKNRDDEILFHCRFLYASPTPVISMSISLIPMKGMMIPPAP